MTLVIRTLWSKCPLAKLSSSEDSYFKLPRLPNLSCLSSSHISESMQSVNLDGTTDSQMVSSSVEYSFEIEEITDETKRQELLNNHRKYVEGGTHKKVIRRQKLATGKKKKKEETKKEVIEEVKQKEIEANKEVIENNLQEINKESKQESKECIKEIKEEIINEIQEEVVVEISETMQEIPLDNPQKEKEVSSNNIEADLSNKLIEYSQSLEITDQPKNEPSTNSEALIVNSSDSQIIKDAFVETIEMQPENKTENFEIESNEISVVETKEVKEELKTNRKEEK